MITKNEEEKRKMNNDNLTRWQKIRKSLVNKKDEFYTPLYLIEDELKNYYSFLKDKVVYCNCDDTEKSNFYKYFKDNFSKLELKGLVATCYNKDYSVEYFGGRGCKITPLKSNGDFRSEECLELLKKSDIVVTNPPFSLFRDFMEILDSNNKDFIVIGNINIVGYNSIFPLIKKNRLFIGENSNKIMEFIVPDDYPVETEFTRIDSDGKRLMSVISARWFTSRKITENLPFLPLLYNYNPLNYKRYLNYDAINVDRTADIPSDYEGEMGVPVTFLDKHNPEQFEIVALGKEGSFIPTHIKRVKVLKEGKFIGKYHNLNMLYLKYSHDVEEYPKYQDMENEDFYEVPYARILIKNKNPKKVINLYIGQIK